MYCQNCGKPIPNSLVFCPECGAPQGAARNVTRSQPQPQSVNVNVNTGSGVNAFGYKPKSRWVAFWLCVFGGMFGLHYFYVGRIFRGIVSICTLNFFMIGWGIDILVCLFGNFRDKRGMPLV